MRLADAAADLFLGSCCPGCDRPGLGLCGDCARRLAGPAPARVPVPGLIVVAAGPSDDRLRRLVSAHKERSAWHLAGPLGERLALAVRHLVAGTGATAVPLWLVPVPSTRGAVRARGYDATAALARRAGRQLPAASVVRVLQHRRSVRDQSGLDRAERERNLAGALGCRGRAPDRHHAVVIVDDLVTTGATVVEAHRALTAAGHRVLGAAVVGAAT